MFAREHPIFSPIITLDILRPLLRCFWFIARFRFCLFSLHVKLVLELNFFFRKKKPFPKRNPADLIVSYAFGEVVFLNKRALKVLGT